MSLLESVERIGRQAAESGTPKASNPYRETADTSNTASLCMHAWDRGWADFMVAEFAPAPEPENLSLF